MMQYIYRIFQLIAMFRKFFWWTLQIDTQTSNLANIALLKAPMIGGVMSYRGAFYIGGVKTGYQQSCYQTVADK